MVYGYARVSTPGQAKNGYGLVIQEDDLKDYGCEEIYKEVASGATLERPVLTGIIDNMERGDTIVVTKADRLTRSYEDYKAIKKMVERKGAFLKVLEYDEMDKSDAWKDMIALLPILSEEQRKKLMEILTDSGGDKTFERCTNLF